MEEIAFAHTPAVPHRALTGIRFDRNEFSGAFGDIGTDLPLLVGMILAAKLDPASVFIVYGAMQVATALTYRMPMPVQPLKAVAALVIAQKVPGNVLFGGGLAIGIIMLVLTVTGAIDWLARIIPKSVIRGVQFGLGLQLATLALREYVPAAGVPGYLLAAVAFAITLALLGNRRFPPAIFVLSLGVVFALATAVNLHMLGDNIGLRMPTLRVPAWSDITAGALLLALPQVPLSLGNSLLATRQIAADLFPERPPLALRRIALTYSAMNLVNPFFGGVPTCHGSGGMVGHYTFGGRTGGSVVIYGIFYLTIGLILSVGFGAVVTLFPRPILGVLLFFEGLVLLMLVRDLADTRRDLMIAMLVGLIASTMPYGYLVGMVVGTVVSRLPLATNTQSS